MVNIWTGGLLDAVEVFCEWKTAAGSSRSGAEPAASGEALSTSKDKKKGRGYGGIYDVPESCFPAGQGGREKSSNSFSFRSVPKVAGSLWPLAFHRSFPA